MNWTILRLIEWTADFFTKHGVPNPRLDAELLLAHTLNKKRIDLYLGFEQIVGEQALAIYKDYIQRRARREPLQYITGIQEFWGIPIKVTPAVMIPRQETEVVVEVVLKILQQNTSDERRLPAVVPTDVGTKAGATILDLCTGSGAIIAALANELPDASFTGVDISEEALEVARQNTSQWKDRVRLMCGDLFEPLVTREARGSFLVLDASQEAGGSKVEAGLGPSSVGLSDSSIGTSPDDGTIFPSRKNRLPRRGSSIRQMIFPKGKIMSDRDINNDGRASISPFDLIISNPPYITESEYTDLQPEVRDFEPKAALLAGPDGLDFYRRIIEEAPNSLNSGGWLVLELGDGRTEEVANLIKTSGRFETPVITKDLNQLDRVLQTRLAERG